jgi:hypothetical protein
MRCSAAIELCCKISSNERFETLMDLNLAFSTAPQPKDFLRSICASLRRSLCLCSDQFVWNFALNFWFFAFWFL